MNNYVSATAELFSEDKEMMYSILFGGITYGYFEGQEFTTDSEFPFTNQVTTVQVDKDMNFTQFIMENEYPLIQCELYNDNSPLRFGAGALFIPNDRLPAYQNGVLAYDNFIDDTTVIGYIIGGIYSAVGNTTDQNVQTAASPFIFKVSMGPRA